MQASWRTCCALILALCAIGTPVLGTQIVVERVGATSQGYLFVDYRLDQPFQGKVLDGVRSGLPSTLTYTIEVWRQRSGWWDKLEETRESRLRVLRDLLNDQYILVSPEEVRRFADLESLTQAACSNRKEYLRPLSPDKSYYVTITANLAPLSVEDLKELEEWLQGTLRTGESHAGGIAGISGTMVGMLMSMTGFGDETVHGRTPSFVPDDLRRARPAPNGSTPVAKQPSPPHAAPATPAPGGHPREP
jgi:hypothetical protein